MNAYTIRYMLTTLLLSWPRLPVLSPDDVCGGRWDSSHLHGKAAHMVNINSFIFKVNYSLSQVTVFLTF